MRSTCYPVYLAVAALLLAVAMPGLGQETGPESTRQQPAQEEDTIPPPEEDTEADIEARRLDPPPAHWARLSQEYEIWINLRAKEVILGGEICLRRGQLEMFACPEQTKEHESIVAVRCPAQFVHAALLAVGAEPGTPVRYDPDYQPATGSVIRVEVEFVDDEGKTQRIRAQDWIRRTRTGEVMQHDWVFAGSGFWTDESTGERYYYADAGELICVSNFSTATMDIPVESSDANASLVFSAYTERIPPRRTPVRLILTPVPPESEAADGSEDGDKDDDDGDDDDGDDDDGDDDDGDDDGDAGDGDAGDGDGDDRRATSAGARS